MFHVKHLVPLVILATFSCSTKKKDPLEPAPNDKVPALKALYLERTKEAEGLRDKANGWLTPLDCDGWQVTGKYAASPLVMSVDFTAAEYPTEPGRFHRRPLSLPCWTPEGGDTGSKTTWSRDMGLGVAVYAWSVRDRALLERHIAYGKTHPAKWEGLPAWKMGEPLADGRAIYSPALIGLLYQVLHALGGEDNPDRAWPNYYTKGLRDYQAHLQALDILVRGEVSEARKEEDAMPTAEGEADDVAGDEIALTAEDGDFWQAKDGSLRLMSIGESMYQRLKEHAEREPRDPLYTYLNGLYLGDLSPAVDNCLAEDMPLGEYAHCGGTEERACRLAHWIFACGRVLKRYEAL